VEDKQRSFLFISSSDSKKNVRRFLKNVGDFSKNVGVFFQNVGSFWGESLTISACFSKVWQCVWQRVWLKKWSVVIG